MTNNNNNIAKVPNKSCDIKKSYKWKALQLKKLPRKHDNQIPLVKHITKQKRLRNKKKEITYILHRLTKLTNLVKFFVCLGKRKDEICKKVYPNHKLLQALLPKIKHSWLLSSTQINNVYITKNLLPFDPLYRMVIQKMNASYKMISIKSIEHIQNPYVHMLYNAKYRELQAKYSFNLSERYLFHGTQMAKVNSIARMNLNHRLCGTQRGNVYGKGMSFSPDFFYSTYFCEKSIEKVCFLCRVLYIKSHVGVSTTIVPNEGFDTTNRTNGKVIVKYNDDEFYPEFKITFIKYTRDAKINI